ncbi:SDR family oxidoreductase [Nocardioides mangrovicus]|uniref:SDR family oxidoreductase n=1 Tax=Nocardioides mangrovicus TaxID=2478913 RepID=A0A3L8P4U6_9ACTN|nr:SDR family oxidoreductase [Nocardioides mangrovicus]RLV49609.1 SDR family oxidoreductase [Nocardioides mangrovicus]
MRVVIAGGHGQIAQHLERELQAAGHQAVGMVRRAEQVPDLEDNGAEAVVVDLEATDVATLAGIVEGAGAVVFAAGGGADGNAARKETVDKGAAIMLADAAEQAGVRRYLMVSAMGTENADPDSEDVFQVYLRAKQAADDDLRRRDLDWTIVRPGRLTDEPGTGLVQVGSLDRGEVTREDVAAVLVHCLDRVSTVGKTFDLLNGEQEIDEALRRV